MPEISQKLSFNASGAINSLSNLARSTREASNAFRELNTASTKLQGGIAGITTGSRSLKTTGKGLEKTKKSTERLTVSWKTLARVVATQLTVRGLNALITGLSSAIKRSRDLGLALAEIGSIAGGQLGVNMSTLSNDVLRLSTALGESAESVAEGIYQTLSNQVVEASEALQFYEKSASLARITNAESADVVNALSSVMNSYALEVSETDKVMDTLFKTIELGRVRMSELGTTIGRVLPIASQMGVEYQEVAAAIAVMTRQGVKANAAITQLRAVLQKILRPSDEMEKIFRSWGVESGPEAIRAFGGLRGVLLKLQEETNFNVAAQGELFQRVRAITSAMSLGVDQGREFAETYQEISEATGVAAEKIQEFQSTIEFELLQNQQEFENSWTRLGRNTLPLATNALRNINALIEGGSLIIAEILTGTSGFAKLQQEIDQRQNEINEKVQEFKENYEIPELERFDAELKKAARFYTEVNRMELELRETRQESIDIANEGISKAGRDVLSAYEDSIKELEKFLDDAKELSKETSKEVGAIQEEIDKRTIDNRLERARGANQKLAIIEQEFIEQQKKSRQALQDIDASPESRDRAIAEAERLDRLARQGEQLAENAGILSAQRRFEERGLIALNNQQSAHKIYQNQVEDTTEAVEEEVQARKRARGELEALTKRQERLFERLSEVDPEEDPEVARRVGEQIQQVQEEIKQILAKTDLSSEFLSSFGLDKNFQTIRDGFEQAINEAQFDWANLVESAQAEFDDAIITIKARIDPIVDTESTAKALGADLTGLTQAGGVQRVGETARQVLQQQGRGERDIQGEQMRIATAEKGILDISKQVRDSYLNRVEAQRQSLAKLYEGVRGGEELANRFNNVNPAIQRNLQLLNTYNSLVSQAVNEASTQGQVTLQTADALQNVITAMQNFRIISSENSKLFTDQVGLLGEIQQRAANVNRIQENLPEQDKVEAARVYLQNLTLQNERAAAVEKETENAKQNLRESGRAAGDAASKSGALSSNLGNAQTAAGGAAQGIFSLSGAISAAIPRATTLANELERAARAQAATGSAGAAFHGGPASRFFADGGLFRGQDRTLVSMARGEMVINSRDSRRFFSELNAMNQSSEPVFREQGGTVTNVGDVNVTVQGGDSSQQTVREIGHALRREIQRGNIKLR